MSLPRSAIIVGLATRRTLFAAAHTRSVVGAFASVADCAVEPQRVALPLQRALAEGEVAL